MYNNCEWEFECSEKIEKVIQDADEWRKWMRKMNVGGGNCEIGTFERIDR